MNAIEANLNARIPTARLASFYFAYYAALGAFNPYWALYLKGLGQDVAAISILMSLWYGTRIFAPSAWSALAARSAQPILWLRMGSVLTVASFTLFSVPHDFTVLFVVMCVFCFVYNAIMPQFESITLSHLVGRSERYGRIRVWGSIGFVVVVAVFGVLLDYLPVTALPWLMLPFFVAMAIASFFNDYGRPPVAVTDTESTSFIARLRRPEVIAFFIVALLMQISFGPYYTFYSIYLDEHGYRTSALGIYWSIGVIVEILVFAFSVRIFRRWNAATVLIVSLIAASLRWAMIALWPDNAILMAFAQTLHALSFAAFFAASMQFLVLYFPGRQNGHAQGIYYGFSSGIGGVLGALLSGQVWQATGGETAFMLGSVTAAIAALIAWIWIRPGRPSASA
ncbi:MAG: MFS transporter [Dokdonella sp.]|uniref:MFS transporter n=2 Tax=Dokdonella sp. TaxID=2291710 RepID=UPI002CF0EF8C|nr:MFS transporter [Xanthomonadales bacterium]MBK7208762.1 MFS transporter [Xanthomonadales bacterium]MBL0221795.1 MFS transporter [Xanthomonadales bacterium]HQV72989.1 MFS transporter [Dokdonella sp.]HQZ62926.1 MFS transporter [Dokdonella sp.]